MRTWSPILLAALSLAACLEPSPRGALVLELRGPAYPRPRCSKGAASLGSVHARGEPVAGARVTLSPGGRSGVTDANGRLELGDLPEESYTLAISAAGFAPATANAVVRSGKTVSLGPSLAPCIATTGNRHRVGFGTEVALSVTNHCGAAWEGATFTWTQVEGPDARASVSNWGAATLVFTTRPIEEVRELPDAPQLLSFSHDEAGEYVFQVSARNKAGETSRDHVLVTSTNVATGVNSVPPFDTYYFVGEKKGPWKWKIIKWPQGWPETLAGETTRTPSVRPVPPGPIAVQQTIIIQDQETLLTFSLVIGEWNQVNRDCGRGECHPTIQKAWEGTRHALTWRKLVDGELVSARGPAAESCGTCHTLGYDPSAPNGGYDDVAAARGASFPVTPAPGSYEAFPSPVKEVSNVYCVACHGPARVDPPVAEQPGRFAVGVCARCHDRKPEQDLVAQWRQSKMARTVKGDPNGAEARAECKGCHTAQGFYYGKVALGRQPSDKVVVMTCCENLAPITCQTCHSPMHATNKAQVWRYDAVKTASGLSLERVGSGALCTICHNTDHDTRAPGPLAARLAPHSPQADLSYGRGGYAIPPPTGIELPALVGIACAKDAGEGCVSCHMDKGPLAGEPGHRTVGDHTFRMTSSEGTPNTRPCQACHEGRASFDPTAKGDYDGDGRVEGVRDEVDGLLALLRARLGAAIEARSYRGCDAGKAAGVSVKAGDRYRIVVTDLLGFDLGDCDRSGAIEREERAFTFPDADLLLHQAAYNLLFVEADKSRGLHNHPYTVKLLQRTIVALTAGKGLPAWELRR